MAFDSEDLARARVTKLRDFLAEAPAAKFNMNVWHHQINGCDTVACIGGWTETLFDKKISGRLERVADLLGMTFDQANELCYPTAIETDDNGEWPISVGQAVAVLDHYLEAGWIDWAAVL